ncbi:YigZ family protein [Sporolactobacillus sp. Y61]|uniref:YigZ family protein n=1 Tax=Sporolactobacillus sp. Y61 TaxID=3160863 RepID=A0AAU8IBP1_9BACL
MVLIPYRTVRHQGRAETDIRRSRFLTFAAPVQTEEEAEAFIQSRRKEDWKANHHCYAYIIGKKKEIQKASDDGEPSGTAGVPILDVLKRRGVTDTLVIVTRYFGGIKLGAGGLIRAYAHSAAAGLHAAEVIDQIPSTLWKVTVDYHLSGMLDNRLRDSPWQIKNVDYTDRVTCHVYTEQKAGKQFRTWIQDLTSAQAEVEQEEELYLSRRAPEPGEEP